ncbi:MAG: hypothetical protein ACJ757_16850 [Gaiellaceae bacterium]
MSKSFRSARSPDTSAGAFDGRPARLARRPFPNPDSERRELARRSSAGVDVTLYWHPTLDELIVRVCDERHRAHFEIRPQRHLALDVYYHPYAYADLAGVYEKENRRAA